MKAFVPIGIPNDHSHEDFLKQGIFGPGATKNLHVFLES